MKSIARRWRLDASNVASAVGAIVIGALVYGLAVGSGGVAPLDRTALVLACLAAAAIIAAARRFRSRQDSTRGLAAQASKESGARYRGLLEAAPDAMVVVNELGEIVLLNLQAEKQFGYRRDELVGQQVKSIIPEGFAERLIADGTRSAADALAQQIGTGIELCARRKDGTEFPIEIMLSPLQSADGILVTAAIRNISVRKAAESRLAQMERRYRGLLEAAPDGMVVVNARGEIILLNLQAERQFGYVGDELVGQEVKRIIPEGFAERLVPVARSEASSAPSDRTRSQSARSRSSSEQPSASLSRTRCARRDEGSCRGSREAGSGELVERDELARISSPAAIWP